MRKNIASAILSEGFEAIKAATGIDPVEDPGVIASKYNAIEGVRPLSTTRCPGRPVSVCPRVSRVFCPP